MTSKKKNQNRPTSVSGLGMLTMELETRSYDYSTVFAAFQRQGWDRWCPSEPGDAEAFLKTRHELNVAGQNPKAHGSKLPLLPDYRVSFNKVLQTTGKAEIVVNVTAQHASKRGEDAPCRQVIIFKNGNVEFHKPDRLDPVDYDPNFMKAEFLKGYAENRKVSSEAIRMQLQTYILPHLFPMWVKGRSVAFYKESADNVAKAIVTLLNDIGNPSPVAAWLFDVTDRNKADLAAGFVKSIRSNTEETLKEIRKSLDSGHEIRQKSYEGFGKKLADLKANVGYYQTLLGVGSDMIQTYMEEIGQVERKVFAHLTGGILPATATVEATVEAMIEPTATAMIEPTATATDASDPFAELA